MKCRRYRSTFTETTSVYLNWQIKSAATWIVHRWPWCLKNESLEESLDSSPWLAWKRNRRRGRRLLRWAWFEVHGSGPAQVKQTFHPSGSGESVSDLSMKHNTMICPSAGHRTPLNRPHSGCPLYHTQWKQNAWRTPIRSRLTPSFSPYLSLIVLKSHYLIISMTITRASIPKSKMWKELPHRVNSDVNNDHYSEAQRRTRHRTAAGEEVKVFR